MKAKTLWIIAMLVILICGILVFMKLNPSTVKKFQSQIPEIKQFFLNHKEEFLKVEEILDSKKNNVKFSFFRNSQNRDEIMIYYNYVSDSLLESQIDYNIPYTLKSCNLLSNYEKEIITQLFKVNQNDISIMSNSTGSDYRLELVSRTELKIDRMDEEALTLARSNPYFITIENIVDDWYIVIFEPQKRLD